jgi:hypothetical protein
MVPEADAKYIVEKLDSHLGYVCDAILSQEPQGYFFFLVSLVDIYSSNCE